MPNVSVTLLEEYTFDVVLADAVATVTVSVRDEIAFDAVLEPIVITEELGADS